MMHQTLNRGSVQHSCIPSRRSACIVRAYEPPSRATAATELQLLKRFSDVVPDATPLSKSKFPPRAASVSPGVLRSIVASESLGFKPYENAILTAMAFDRCRSLPPAERAQCQMDKAVVNVGALFAKEVEGSVLTDIGGNLASNTEQMVSKATHLLSLYKESGVPSSKVLFRLPATWAGIQAAKQLEAKGITTQVYMVFSMVQAVAAAQAGASVIEPGMARTREWFVKFPNMIRDPLGPRQDAGYMSSVDPGIDLVKQIYTYVKKFHPKTKVIATSIRSRQDVLALSGVDIIVLPGKVLEELDATATVAGYNDGLTVSNTQEESHEMPGLSPALAQTSDIEQMAVVDEAMFDMALGMAATELLKQGLEQQGADAAALLPHFEKSTSTSANF